MSVDHPPLSPERPEWRRSGSFFLLSLALHAAALFYPIQMVVGILGTPQPSPIVVRLEQAAPAALAEPPKIQPPPPQAASTPRRQRPAPTPRPVIAMTPEQSAPAPAFTAPAPVIASPAAPAAQTAAVANPAPAVTVSAARFDAAYLDNPRPNYPARSRRLGEEGKVLLRVRVSPDGTAAAVDLEKSSNFERLDEAARQAVASWRFVPAKRGDEAIEAVIIVPLVFRMED